MLERSAGKNVTRHLLTRRAGPDFEVLIKKSIISSKPAAFEGFEEYMKF